VVSPEPTPYRSPLFDRIAARDDVELTVVYAARTVADRTWSVAPAHRAVELRGVSLPGASRLVHHDYPVTLGIRRALQRSAPDVVVVSGWSTFAAQAALAWCRVRRVPYVLLVVSHDAGRRAGWRSTVNGAVVPRVVRGAAGVLVVGSLARDSVLARGARADGIRVFANTVDVAGFGEQADALAGRRGELRRALGLVEDDVAVLSVSRLAPEKRHDLLIGAVAAAGDPRLALVLVGDGPERDALERLASTSGVRLTLAGDRPWDEIAEAYVAADVFALLSERETWGVVVNEAAACGLPLVLSDRVGAAADLLRDGDNGVLVPAGDTAPAAAALVQLARNPELRHAMGARSREIAAAWGYEPSVEAFVEAVREAAAR
jgi:glycosyltransferase involved in cell wall biosynthesis